MKTNSKSISLAAALLTSAVSMNVTAATLNNNYACVPAHMIEEGVKPNLKDLCDARKVNAEEGFELDARGCAKEYDSAAAITPEMWGTGFLEGADVIRQVKLSFDNGKPIKLKDCDYYDVVAIWMEL